MLSLGVGAFPHGKSPTHPMMSYKPLCLETACLNLCSCCYGECGFPRTLAQERVSNRVLEELFPAAGHMHVTCTEEPSP